MAKKDEKGAALPALTPKQFAFLEGIQKGLSKTDAYKQAYDCENMAKESIWVAASRTYSNANIRLWLESIKRDAVRKLTDEATYTLKHHLDELNDLIDEAKREGAYTPALNGIIAKGKATNKYTSHSEVNVNNTADQALLEKIDRMLGHESMISAAREMGYKLDDIQPEERKH